MAGIGQIIKGYWRDVVVRASVMESRLQDFRIFIRGLLKK